MPLVESQQESDARRLDRPLLLCRVEMQRRTALPVMTPSTRQPGRGSRGPLLQKTWERSTTAWSPAAEPTTAVSGTSPRAVRAPYSSL